MMKRLLLIGLVVFALVGTVNASWQIQGSSYTGTIDFYQDGLGIAHIDNYPAVTFEYKQIAPGQYEARYLWYAVKFKLENSVITSDDFPYAKLVRV
jgi:hypothetical protein